MALTSIPCEHTEKEDCCGYLTDTEVEMNRIDPSRTVQEYHEVMSLFERAFDNLHQ